MAIPSPGALSTLRRVSRGAMDGRVVAVRAGEDERERDDYGQPIGDPPAEAVVFDEACAVGDDRLRVERAAAGDSSLAGADAVLRIDRAGALLEQDLGALALEVTYGPADERVTRTCTLEGMRHGRVAVYLFVTWGATSRPATEAAP